MGMALFTKNRGFSILGTFCILCGIMSIYTAFVGIVQKIVFENNIYFFLLIYALLYSFTHLH
jgi:hypothetical protein